MSTLTVQPSSKAAIKELVVEDRIANESYVPMYNERRSLRIAVTAQGVVIVVLVGALALVSNRPVANRYISIDAMGHATPIQYSDLRFVPTDGMVRSGLTEWAHYRYTIDRDAITKSYPNSFFFIDRPLASSLMRNDSEAHLRTEVLANRVEPSTVEVKDVALETKTTESIGDTTVARGTAHMIYDRVYSDRTQTPRTEHWEAAITYYMNPAQVNEHSSTDPKYGIINPLGLTITELHENRVSVTLTPVGTSAGSAMEAR